MRVTLFRAALFWSIFGFPAAVAQPLLVPGEPPAELVREAIAHPYGRALVARFAANVRRDADTACLAARNLDATALTERGHALFLRYGTRIMEFLHNNIDAQLYDKAIEAEGGYNAKVEFLRLRANPDVQQAIAIERPIRLAKVLEFIFVTFDRMAQIKRIRLRAIASGDEALERANPTEQAEEDLERFVRARNSRQVERFLNLSAAANVAFDKAFSREFSLKWGPVQFYAGIDADLAEICVAMP